MTVRTIASAADVGGLRLTDLSDWFNPFLEYFMLESLRCGGEVAVGEDPGGLQAIYLYSPGERIASVFTRSRPWAEEFLRRKDGVSMYAPFALTPAAETFVIYSVDPRLGKDGAPFRHPVRVATPSDLPRVLELLRQVYGDVDEAWVATMPRSSERCFVVEIERQLAGAAWASAVGTHGRLHSLTVRPGFRRLGIGRELFRARMLWLGAVGVTEVLSEIAERNVPSRAIAEQGEMRRVGEIYRHPAEGPPRAGSS